MQHEFGYGARNPVDAIEDVAHGREWSFEREGPDEIAVRVDGAWTQYDIAFAWIEAHEALHVSCTFDQKVPAARLDETLRLVAAVNERLVFGHMEAWIKDDTVCYRHALPLHGAAEPTDAQVEALLAAAIEACERHYQAFQFVVWAGKGAGDALDSVLFDTVGQA